MKIRIEGYLYNPISKEEYKDEIKATVVKEGWSGTIEKRFIRPEKIKEMEEIGFAYCNRPKEFVV